ncbi:MAG TPA: cytochrome c [Burkholderiales bacterium]|nr:cytochrome c [Burkholderiales bacterium]
MSRTLLSAVLGAALALGAQAALAQPKPPPEKAPTVKDDPAARPERTLDNLLAMCAGCHGIPGYRTAFPDVYHVPKIFGQQPAYLVAALKAYASGERSHPSMRGIAAGLSEEEMKQLAEYFGKPAK